jgi:AraC-like DNA-binding protein
LDRLSLTLINRMALEDYSLEETAALTGESERSVTRIYGEAMNRLTAVFLQFGLLMPNVENLSRGEAKIESNEAT